VRLAGADRIATAIAVSQNAFPSGGSAKAAVIARADSFADALAGTPLAATKIGPLLLTASGSLDNRVGTELGRALPAGSTVYLLGGTTALSAGIDQSVAALGYQVVRFSGSDRYDTAAKVANDGLGAPSKVILATGLDFPDALCAGAAGAHLSAAVLLTAGPNMPAATSNDLAAHPPASRWAIGGQAAAADPGATPVVGTDRYDTSAKAASTFFAAPTGFGAALGSGFPDALSGGAHAAKTTAGPLLLVATSAPLPPPIASYLSATKSSLSKGYLYGGPAVVDDTTLNALNAALA
jgi:hypothetical protein